MIRRRQPAPKPGLLAYHEPLEWAIPAGSYVYILHNTPDRADTNILYIGSTDDLARRLAEWLNGTATAQGTPLNGHIKSISVIPRPNTHSAETLELLLIDHYQPPHNAAGTLEYERQRRARALTRTNGPTRTAKTSR